MPTPAHRLIPMRGRDPDEQHRAATPLELLFDLTFVVAFGQAGNELAHALASHHVGSGLAAFGVSVFAICWAWINFSWFASAYDTDDWAFRVLTMVQMGGVIVMALGLPNLFAGFAHGEFDGTVMIVGYVVMRVALIGQWLRAARQDPARRRCAMAYVLTLAVGQVLWVLLLVPHLSTGGFFALAAVPAAVELAGPYLAESRLTGTPWHAHHVAERYSLLVIITLGETILGTVAAMSALVHDPDVGWSTDAVIVLAAGVVLTFGMWWAYFVIPWADILHTHRERSFFWGYGHMLIFGGIAATGAGLHVAQYLVEGETTLGTTGTLVTVVVPFAVFAGMLYLMYAVSMRAADPFHIALVVATAAVLGAGLLATAAGASLPVGLAVVALAPLVTVVGYETLGHRHLDDHLERLRS
ncbi:low temperature requirement protein A [Luteipulveratus flavus]|uniref:Low temperature requirement protein A n=1 Tax=Luteipulveratus flavus TaxID=3031728 RepID=A0ABT6CA51_9MICO|nr:low temperature requirement protein A [Luteipulveratus sp. YIM 133296]MDF8265197.1 low temperature requirement protein A [Luteipulveratus sp. YIM 133296]